jgi:uncharacterized protein YecE (DUF72 family)
MLNALRCGTSGWSHPDWNSVVYPAVKARGFHPLEFLSQHLDMVEIDTSFDQPLRPEIAKLWLKKGGPSPQFSIFGDSRQAIHARTPARPDSIQTFKEGLWPLRSAGKLGCLLMRFPIRSGSMSKIATS